jgi:hypothetical protein
MQKTVAAASREKKRKDHDKKLTKVLSTKISIEDYNRIENYTNFAYKAGMIEEHPHRNSYDL